MSAPALTATASLLEPLAGRWAVLLRTRKRDGSWVGTPVNLAVEGERAYFGAPADSWKVKRLRNFEEVEVAPSTLRGRPTGLSFSARARLLSGDEARAAERLLLASTRSCTVCSCPSSCGSSGRPTPSMS